LNASQLNAPIPTHCGTITTTFWFCKIHEIESSGTKIEVQVTGQFPRSSKAHRIGYQNKYSWKPPESCFSQCAILGRQRKVRHCGNLLQEHGNLHRKFLLG